MSNEALDLYGRVQPCPSTSRSTAKRTIIDTSLLPRLGYYSPNPPRKHDEFECSFGGKNAFDRNERVFVNYLEKKAKKRLIIFGISEFDKGCPMRDNQTLANARARIAMSSELEYEAKGLQYKHRWAISYKKRFLFRLHLLENWYRWFDHPVTFLTVTTRHGIDIEDQIMLLKEGWLRIRKEYPGKLSYLAAMDFHRDGYAHYHIVVFGKVPLGFISTISRKWAEWNFGDSVHGLKFLHKKNGEITKIVNYLFKHTAKVFNLNAPGAMRFHTTVFAMQHSENREYPGVRLFSMSRDISNIMKIPESSRECLSFQLDGDLLFVNEDYTREGVREKIQEFLRDFNSLAI